MSFVSIWVHAVWATKNRHPYLDDEIRNRVVFHIKENAMVKEIYIDTINGYTDHLHALISMNPDMSISKVMQLIKGQSAFWINQTKITDKHFEWADEYFAASVSEANLDKVRAYIKNQKEHHSKSDFEEEYDTFIRAHKLNTAAGPNQQFRDARKNH